LTGFSRPFSLLLHPSQHVFTHFRRLFLPAELSRKEVAFSSILKKKKIKIWCYCWAEAENARPRYRAERGKPGYQYFLLFLRKFAEVRVRRNAAEGK
jgi:hypothetical protein